MVETMRADHIRHAFARIVPSRRTVHLFMKRRLHASVVAYPVVLSESAAFCVDDAAQPYWVRLVGMAPPCWSGDGQIDGMPGNDCVVINVDNMFRVRVRCIRELGCGEAAAR